MRDLTCPSNVKCNLRECKKRSQTSSGSFYYFYRVHKREGADRLLTSCPMGTPRRFTRGSHTQGTRWRGELVRHTQPHLSGCLQPTVRDLQRTAANYQVESVPAPLYCKNFNLPLAVPWCWKLPAQALNMIWIWMEKPGDAAWIFRLSFHLSVVKFHF